MTELIGLFHRLFWNIKQAIPINFVEKQVHLWVLYE